MCRKQNIIHRSWRKDFLCGACFNVYEMIDGKVYLLGKQEDLD